MYASVLQRVISAVGDQPAAQYISWSVVIGHGTSGVSRLPGLGHEPSGNSWIIPPKWISVAGDCWRVFEKTVTMLVCSALVRIPFEADNRQSVGKYAAGIRVVDGDGAMPGVSAAVVRNLLYPVDSPPVGYVVGVGWGGAEGSGRRIGDTLAGMRVVRTA